MELDVFIINSFSEKLAEGNPAGVVILKESLSDELLQAIAIDIGKSETAFIKKTYDGKYGIRWFSPKKEMPLCGHATLAAAKVVFETNEISNVTFISCSEMLNVEESADGSISIDFPLDTYKKINIDNIYSKFFNGIPIEECIIGSKTRKVILRINENDNLESIKPDYELMIKNIGIYNSGIGITKKSQMYDFESRYFNPWAGVNEDPITGSVHTVLARYWGEILNKEEMIAKQSSYRPGVLVLRKKDDRVFISGKGKIVIRGKFNI